MIILRYKVGSGKGIKLLFFRQQKGEGKEVIRQVADHFSKQPDCRGTQQTIVLARKCIKKRDPYGSLSAFHRV